MAQSEAKDTAEMIFPDVSDKAGEMKLYVVYCRPSEKKMSGKEKENPWLARKSAIIRAASAGEASACAEAFFNRKSDKDYRAVEINLWGSCTSDENVFIQER